MSYPVFPNLPGQTWSVTKTPMFSTRVAAHVSGREVRAPQYAHGLYQFELVYDGLASNANYPGLFANSLQMLLDLYVQVQGQAGVFVFSDNTDSKARGQVVGTGDGTTTTFQAYRTLIANAEPVSIITYLNAVYINGAPQSGNWAISAPASIAFTSAPAAGAVITADFEFGFRCRFLNDTLELEQFMSNLWAVKSLKFRSVR